MLHMTRVTAALVPPLAAMVIFWPVSALAQTQPAPTTFRSGTELVRLDVRAVDGNRRPVLDLRADEIEVVEDGQRRPILHFQHISDPTAPIMEAAHRTSAGQVSTNRGAPRGQLYLLIFDQAHISPGNEQRARAAAARFLTTRMRPGDRVALYGIPGPGPQIDFTADVERVSADLQKIRGGLERFSYGAVGPMRIQEAIEVTRGNQEVLSRVSERLSTERSGTDVLAISGSSAPGGGGTTNAALFEMLVREDARTMVARADQQARNFLLMFADVIRRLRRIEGRKNVILLSEGFFADNISRELEQVAAAAAESYTVIHALDLNRRQIDIREQEPLGPDQFSEVQSRLGGLGSLSAETDGNVMIDASAALDRSFARVAEDSRDYYLVGFEPSRRADRVGPYRRVIVRTTRPGVRVLTRTGYAAGAFSGKPAERRVTIDAALKAPFPQQGIGVHYTTYILRGPSAGLQKVFVSVAADLPVAERAERAADVVFFVRDVHSGRVMASGTDTMALPVGAEPGSTTGAGHYKVQFDLPAGSYVMRVVVRDPGGLVGSADRRFDVRRLDAAGVTFSDLILSADADMLPVRAVASSARGLSGTLELYGQSRDHLDDVSVVMELTPAGSERSVSIVHADLETVRDDEGSASRVARLAMPLTAVPEGDYLVTSVVRRRGQEIGTTAREVRIVRAAAAAPSPAAAVLDPGRVLDGIPAREYVRALEAEAASPFLREAARHAREGEWPLVAAALPARESAATSVAAGLRGLAKVSAGDYEGAAADLRLAFEMGDRKDARAAFILGWAYLGAGASREAIGAWRAAVFLDPAMVPAHLALAEAYMRLSEPALAIQALRAGLLSVPDSPELKSKLLEIEQRHARRMP